MEYLNVCVLLMLVCCGVGSWHAEAAISVQPPYSTGSYRPVSHVSNSIEQDNKNSAVVSDKNVLDRFSYRYPDGSYEFRYELADGTARYERGYFLTIDKVKSLVVVGYYSYRMPDGRYITVFYNADRNGYRQNQSITPQIYPNLPRSIDVPQSTEQQEYESNTSQRPFVQQPATTTRRSRF